MKNKTIILVILVFATFIHAESASLYSITDGNWSTKSTWSTSVNGTSCNCTPEKTDEVIITHKVDLTSNSAVKSLHIKSSGILQGEYALEFWNNGYLIVEGTMNIGSIEIKNVGVDFTIESSGELTLSGDFNAGDSPITCNGTIEIGGTVTSGTISGDGAITAGGYNVDGSVFGDDTPTSGETYAGQSWTGSGNNVWENTANWSSGTVPTISTSVRIKNTANKPIISSHAECKSLIIDTLSQITINPGASLKVINKIINTAGITGFIIKSSSTATGSLINSTDSIAATVERFVSGNSNKPYHYISSPVNNASFSTIWKSGDYNVYYYDESNSSPSLDQGWIKKSNGILTNGIGYAIVGNTDKTFSFTGFLNALDINVPVTYTTTSGPYPNGDPQGWNLIGNPYPAALSAATFISENTSKLDNTTSQALYFWNNPNGSLVRSDYATRTATTGIHGATDTVALGQAFFVKINSGVSSLSFSNTQKIVSSGTPFFSTYPNAENLKISVMGPNELYNEIAFSFIPDASLEHDALFDAVKLKGNPNIALYSFIDNNPNIYAIQGRPVILDEDLIKLGLNAGVTGDYLFKISDIENISPETGITIIDINTKKSYDLRKGNFKISLVKGEYNNRFFLKISAPVSSIDKKILSKSRINAFSYGNNIFIHQNNDFTGAINVYDPFGKLIHQSSLKIGENKMISLDDYTGIIFVSFIGKDYHKTVKLYIGF